MHLMLTLKGAEELSQRTHRLDLKLRNILFLIQKGTPTIDAILQNSIFPQDEVIEKLRGLVKERFVEVNAGAAPAGAASPSESVVAEARPATLGNAVDPTTIGGSPFARTSRPAFPVLDSGVSMSQARFLLCDFCLDQFGARAQPLIDAIEATSDVAELQQVLDGITAEVRRHIKDQLPVLMATVRDINQTGA
jgi:hypothetical protein